MITDSWQKLPVTSVKFCVGSPTFDLQQASKCLILLHLLQVAFYALHLISLTSLLGFLPWQRSSLLSPRCPGSYPGM